MKSAVSCAEIHQDILSFIPYSEESLRTFLPWLRSCPFLCNDLTTGSLFMWHEDMDVGFCLWHDTFVVRQEINDQVAFSWPWGADPVGMVDCLLTYVRENNLPLRFFAVSEEQWTAIQNDPRLQPARAAYDVRWSDYIYDFEEVLTFQGRKYSGQRNHINKFRKRYGEPQVLPIRSEDREKIEKLFFEYEREHPDANALEKTELRRARQLLSKAEELNLFVAYLAVGEEAAALSIGEIAGDSLIIHVEKALRRFEGAYPVMYQGFVRYVAGQIGHPLRFVNREDDSGDPGLRMSKQQYQPLFQVHKYLVHVFSPACKAWDAVISHDGIVLTAFRESDKAAYLCLNTDVENNRMWGYDYREDESITGPIDENTFYDSAQYDMQAGDSINLAIRLSEEGPMIGEVILWHFTVNGSVEIGCRLFPEYHGKGLGKAAFAAAAEFARDTLGLHPNARCYIDNLASYRMILASGMNRTNKDEEYFYFV
ncbi:MAG: GNAT family N-acetyltransferase [Clostridia bacterium]|nr:GNAT family N-acetyltransferase [Clostridia bacterium]